MIKIVFRFFLITTTLYGCGSKESISLEEENIKTIELTKVFDKKEKVNLSTIANNIEYIQLENSEKNIVSSIDDLNKDIQFINKRIVIKDRSNNLFMFDDLGKFISKIGNIGRGPTEYPSIEEFAVFEEGEKVVIHSAKLQKAIVFNSKGEYVNDFKTGFWPIGLSIYKGNLVFRNPFGRRKLTDYYSLSTFSSKGELIKRLLRKPLEEKADKEKELEMNFTTYNNYTLNDTLRYWETGYGKDTIWSITKDYKEIPSYIINFDDNVRPFDVFAYKKDIGYEDMVKYSNLEYFQESSKYLFLRLYRASEKRGYYVYFNKETNKSVSVEYKKEFKKGINFSFYNDIDGGFPFWPQGKVSDDKMYMLIYGYELKDFLARKKKNPNILDKVGREKLLKLADNSKISDNPILMIVTLKK